MSALLWSEELVVNHPRMDATHQEFVVHLQAVEAALAAVHRPEGGQAQAGAAAAGPALADLIARFDAMVEHTVEHFAQEDRWMAATGFAPENCHSMQHKQVLELLREVRRRLVERNELEWMERLMPELIQWFIQHAQAADAGLAYHLGQVGYDTETGEMHHAAPAEAIEGCGPASSCGH